MALKTYGFSWEPTRRPAVSWTRSTGGASGGNFDSYRVVVSGSSFHLYTVSGGVATSQANYTDTTFTADGLIGIGIGGVPTPNTAITRLTYG